MGSGLRARGAGDVHQAGAPMAGAAQRCVAWRGAPTKRPTPCTHKSKPPAAQGGDRAHQPAGALPARGWHTAAGPGWRRAPQPASLTAAALPARGRALSCRQSGAAAPWRSRCRWQWRCCPQQLQPAGTGQAGRAWVGGWGALGCRFTQPAVVALPCAVARMPPHANHGQCMVVDTRTADRGRDAPQETHALTLICNSAAFLIR